MTILSEGDIDGFLDRVMMTDDLEARDPDDLTTDPFLILDFELSYRLIFSTDITLARLEFTRFLDHFFGDRSELSSLMGEDICLIFVRLDLFLKTTILSVLRFDLSLYLLDGIMVVPDELLDLSRPNIEVENPIGEIIEKLSIMGDDEDRLRIVLEK